MLQVAAHAVPWLAAMYCVIRFLPRVALAATHVMAVTVALFHHAPQRRRNARAILARHPFTRRR